MRILVTGGAGFVGSHICVALLLRGHELVIYDNFSNSSAVAVDRIRELSGRPITAIQGDVLDPGLLGASLRGVDAVIHCAALKAVGESCSQPLRYFENNVSGTIVLLKAMVDRGVRRLVFSSSATVYNPSNRMPVAEDAGLLAGNPYGRSKLMMEEVIRDVCATGQLDAALLRYFNPIGAHPSGRLGEDPRGVPNNLMPYVTQVAIGRRDRLGIFGGDYPTPDGTGIRDYVHVMDLAEAHVNAVELRGIDGGCLVLNLGTGRGYSVLELVATFEQVSGRNVPYVMLPRREGDVAELWADVGRARDVLKWSANYGLTDMCADAWRWQLGNPNGYDEG